MVAIITDQDGCLLRRICFLSSPIIMSSSLMPRDLFDDSYAVES